MVCGKWIGIRGISGNEMGCHGNQEEMVNFYLISMLN